MNQPASSEDNFDDFSTNDQVAGIFRALMARAHAAVEERGRAEGFQARGHDFSMVIRYASASMHPSVILWPCWDCDRPIPGGARCYRRIDARQGNPYVCLPCHEAIEAQTYNRVRARCQGCDEPIHWAADVWLHADEAIKRYRWETCPHCAGVEGGCRRCLHKGRVQVFDHEAVPKGEGGPIDANDDTKREAPAARPARYKARD